MIKIEFGDSINKQYTEFYAYVANLKRKSRLKLRRQCIFVAVLCALFMILCSGCSTYDKDVVRVWRHCPYEFSQNGYFISDAGFGFKEPMFPEETNDNQNR